LVFSSLIKTDGPAPVDTRKSSGNIQAFAIVRDGMLSSRDKMNKVGQYVAVLLVLFGEGWWWFVRDGEHLSTMPLVTKIMVRDSLPKSLERFKRDMGRYPTTREGIEALVTCPTGFEAVWKGPYVEPVTVYRVGGGATGTVEYRVPLDPWGQEFHYCYPGTRTPGGYDVWSLCADKIMSADDIGNWTD
jgi:Type II secretion system (T2SS), protein G